MTGKETLRIVAQAIAEAEKDACYALNDGEMIATVEHTAMCIADAMKRESPRFNRERFLAEALPIASERVKAKLQASLSR